VYEKGAVVFMRGDPGDCLCGVVTGRVRISASRPGGKEVFLNIIEPGDSFGEIALLDGQLRTATPRRWCVPNSLFSGAINSWRYCKLSPNWRLT
jgi:CRP-like cAMP-binding protein